MKLLFLTPQLPYPPHQGTTIRNFNIIKHLAPHHEITLLSFGTPTELDHAEPLRAFCRRIQVAPYPTRSMVQRAVTTLTSPLPDMALRLQSADMHDKFDAMVRAEPFDVVQVEAIEMARYVINSQFTINNCQFVFDDHNAEYVLQRTAFESDLRRPARWHAALYSWIQWHKLAAYERDICRRADVVIACSNTDARAISHLEFTSLQSQRDAAESRIPIIPNGVDTSFFALPNEDCAGNIEQPTLVFTGKMDFRPNIDAMVWFCDDILPRLAAEVPAARLVIVGQKPAPRIAALANRRGVTITGWVPDTRPFLSGGAVYVVPLRMGSGTRLKVLEAMAMGKAIVSTTRGAEGIDAVPERDLVIADTPQEFAEAITALLRDPERRRALGHAARQLVESRYDWRQIVPRLEQVYAMGRKE